MRARCLACGVVGRVSLDPRTMAHFYPEPATPASTAPIQCNRCNSLDVEGVEAGSAAEMHALQRSAGIAERLGARR